MAILKYIAKKKEVIDRRSADGGYYEAECDECGNIFYPKRSSAKYCSRSCTVQAYRKNKKSLEATTNAPKRHENKDLDRPGGVKAVQNKKICEVLGAKNMAKTLRGLDYSVSGLMAKIEIQCRLLQIDGKFKFYDVTIHRISPNKFSLYKEE